MRHIKRYFKGVDIGTVCTGTIAYFGMRTQPLMDQGIISIQSIHHPASATEGFKSPGVYVDEYVFMGFPENEEELQNAPIG